MNFAEKLDTVFGLPTFPIGKFGPAKSLSGVCLAQVTLPMPFNLAETFHQQVALQPRPPAILGPREGACIGYGALQGEIETLAERFNMAGIDSGMNMACTTPVAGITLPSLTRYGCAACGLALNETYGIIEVDTLTTLRKNVVPWAKFCLPKAFNSPGKTKMG